MALEGAPKEFLMAEYQALRSEVILTLGDVRALERYIALGCAAIWSWAATHPESPTILLWVPVALTLLGALRAWTYSRDFHFTHVYIGRLEKTLVGETLPAKETNEAPNGWENYDKEDHNYITISAVVFWVSLLAASFVGTCEIPHGQKQQTMPVTITCTPKPN
jgi:hypothetical protein